MPSRAGSSTATAAWWSGSAAPSRENPTDDSDLYALAERRIGAAAAESDLVERAEGNTRDMLTTLATSLGVEHVTVDFEEPAGDAG